MKRILAALTVLFMVATPATLGASAEGATYAQSPMLDALVESGELPPVELRLPEVPASPVDIHPDYLNLEVGAYGGTIRMISPTVNWSDDVFIGMTENLLTAQSVNTGSYVANIVESYEYNDTLTEFTFRLRKGLKWSDGVELTMEDVEFCVNHFIFNGELTPVIPAYMRDAGSASGNPFVFARIDDETFRISFASPYGGFLAQISIANWKGYTDWIKPAHYLKRFHRDFAEEMHGSLEAYYEFLRPFAAAIGYDDPAVENVWVAVFNQVDCTNWECSDAMAMLTTETFKDCGLTADFPNLYPWEMTGYVDNNYYFERNPYYYKVDAAGQQLPYADEILYYVVESNDLVQLEIISGNVDFVRAKASVDNLTLYREKEDSANIRVFVGKHQNHPTDVIINMNYGMNVDGSVKDDAASRAWQEVVNLIEFRKALAISIDAQEIIDSVYLGLADPQTEFGCVNDTEGAMALLDSAGIVDRDGDGWRETPSGAALQWQLWTSTDISTDYVPVCELLVEFWSEIGLNAAVYPTGGTFMSTANNANEIPMQIIQVQSPIMYFAHGWAVGSWGPLWNEWLRKGGPSGQIPADSEKYLTPPELVQAFYRLDSSIDTVTPQEAVDEVIPAAIDYMAENLFIIMHSTNLKKCVVVNADIGNVPADGLCISFGFALETLYYK